MKVSVVLPNYNYARYLDERIASLLGQTFRDFELIIVDDASTDDSRTVISRYSSDPRVRTTWCEVNSGSAYQRWNDGAALASGEYLLFAGADDSCAPTLLEKLVGVLDAHPDVGIAHARSWVIDAEGARIGTLPARDRWAVDFIASGAEEVPFLVRKNTIPNASAALLRRSVFDQCGGFDTSFRICADYLLWARMLGGSHMAYVAEPLNNFRKHEQTVRSTESARSLIAERYRVVRYILASFAVPEEAREAACEQLALDWLSRLSGNRALADFRVDRATYRVAREVDPSIKGRMVRLARQGCHARRA